MTPREAAELIESVIFRPGWTFVATADGMPAGLVQVLTRIETVDTSYPSPMGNYKVPRAIRRDFTVQVSDSDTREDVLLKLLDEVHAIDVHEDREFLRVPGRGNDHLHGWYAPLNPHHVPGILAWLTAHDRAKRELAKENG